MRIRRWFQYVGIERNPMSVFVVCTFSFIDQFDGLQEHKIPQSNCRCRRAAGGIPYQRSSRCRGDALGS